MSKETTAKLKEPAYKFFKEPSRENFIQLISNGIGEQNNLDFKQEWIDFSKLAKHILGIANSGGGAIIIGVKEKDNGTMQAVGIKEFKDKAKIYDGTSKFLPEALKYEISDFNFTDESYSIIKGKLFQIVMIDSEDSKLPYIVNKDIEKSPAGCIYIREGTRTVLANTSQIEELINKKIKATYSTVMVLNLEDHIKQLNALYESIEPIKYKYVSTLSDIFKNPLNFMSKRVEIENESYPSESFDDFISTMIEKKKFKIERLLDLK